jgi:MarR family transcriptional regulator, organic hydroperoxide resistance regulator
VRALRPRLAGHSVPFGHWTFLRILWEQDGITQRELSDEAGVMEPTTFAALRAMEELGYVTRRQTAENRKNVYVYLTPKGRALQDKLVPLAVEVNAIATGGISAADLAATRRALLAMIANLSRDLSRSSPWKPSPRARTSRSPRG